MCGWVNFSGPETKMQHHVLLAFLPSHQMTCSFRGPNSMCVSDSIPFATTILISWCMIHLQNNLAFQTAPSTSSSHRPSGRRDSPIPKSFIPTSTIVSPSYQWNVSPSYLPTSLSYTNLPPWFQPYQRLSFIPSPANISPYQWNVSPSYQWLSLIPTSLPDTNLTTSPPHTNESLLCQPCQRLSFIPSSAIISTSYQPLSFIPTYTPL